MQQALDKAAHWTNNACLNFSISKSVVMLFQRKLSKLVIKPLKLNGQPLRYVSEVTYLGVRFDSHLSWLPHIQQKITKAKRFLMLLRGIVGTHWGTSPLLTRWSFTGIARPGLTYSALVWSQVCELKTVQADLLKLNRLAALPVAPVRKSTPTVGLEVACHIISCHYLSSFRAKPSRRTTE
jgi:hypothetical protein